MFAFFEKNAPLPVEASALRPGCFGKLPIHHDFIRCNLASRESNTLEKWIQEGIACIVRKHPKDWPAIYRNFGLHHFAWAGSEQEAALVGSLSSSRDKSGRIYPFVTLSPVADAVFRHHRATLPLACDSYYRASEALIAQAPGLPSPSVIPRKLDELAIEPPSRLQRELLAQQIALLKNIPFKRYWTGLPIPQESREQFWCCFYDIMKTVQSRGPGKTHWGLRIPLPPQEEPTPFVVFWVQMVESILENRFWRAHYFWNRQTETGMAALTLFFRPLPPSHLLPLLNQNLNDNAVFDLGREWPDLTEVGSRVDLRRLLENDDIPLLEVLYRTGRREMLR